MPGKHLTEEEKREIINSDLTNVELAKIYGKHPDTISKTRLKAGKGRGRLPNKFSGNFRVTDEQMEIVKNPKYNRREVHIITGISEKHITKLRREHNVPGGRKRNMSPKVKNVVVRAKKEVKPKIRVITSTVLKYGSKDINITEKPDKIHAGTSDYQRSKIIKLQVSDLIEKQNLTDSDKIKNKTHKYVTRIGKYGIKETVLTKI